MSKLDYYQILGLQKNASDYDIKRAYKKLAIKYHPDHNIGNPSAEEKFKEIKEAYEILINHNKRSAYDKYGHKAFEYQNVDSNYSYESNFSSNFGDIFGDIFSDIFDNNKKKDSSKGKDIFYDLEISFEEAFKGCSKDIKVSILDICNYCNGSGAKDGLYIKCNSCEGTGVIKIRQGYFLIQQTCHNCKGNKKIIRHICEYCSGNCYVKKIKFISIEIPSGIDNNDKIKMVGKGDINKNNSQRGDLYINIKIKSHSIFSRKGKDLYCEVPINFSIAALGGEIEIPSIDGKIKLKIPIETQTGTLFKIKGKGIKKNNYNGDLFCKIIIETPINLDNEQKNLLYKLGNSFKNCSTNKNSPLLKNFLNEIKKFLDNLTKIGK